jgi:hypothetical protein
MSWKKLLATTVILWGTGSMGSIAFGQSMGSRNFEPVQLEKLPNVYEQISTYNSGDIFDDMSPWDYVDLGFGPKGFPIGNYPEHQVVKDYAVLRVVFDDMLEQQVASDPVIRTIDLVNPYNTSLRAISTYRDAREFTYERPPMYSPTPRR